MSEYDSVRPASPAHGLWLESQAIITSQPLVFEICQGTSSPPDSPSCLPDHIQKLSHPHQSPNKNQEAKLRSCHLARCPQHLLLLLFLQHGIKDRHDPVLKLAIVVIGDHHVPNPIQALLPQLCTFQVKLSRIRWGQALQRQVYWMNIAVLCYLLYTITSLAVHGACRTLSVLSLLFMMLFMT